MTADDVRDRLRKLMSAQGMRQKQVAAAVGVTVPFVSAFLKGYRPPSEKICRYVGVRKVVIYERVKA